MTIRVVLADDQEIVRTGLRMILDAQADIEVEGKRRTLTAGAGPVRLGNAAAPGGGNEIVLTAGSGFSGGASAEYEMAVDSTSLTVADFKDDVTLGADLTVTGTTVSFEKTVNGDLAVNNRTLRVDAGGVTTLGGVVGGTAALGSVFTDTAGSVVVSTTAAMPPLRAASMPSGASSNTMQASGATPMRRAASRKMAGSGLINCTLAENTPSWKQPRKGLACSSTSA